MLVFHSRNMLLASSIFFSFRYTSAYVSSPLKMRSMFSLPIISGVSWKVVWYIQSSLSIHCMPRSLRRKKGSSMILLSIRSVCTTPGTVAGYQLLSLACLNFHPSFSSLRRGTAIRRALHRSDEVSKDARFRFKFGFFIMYKMFLSPKIIIMRLCQK